MPAIGRGYLSIIKTIRSYRLSRTGAVVFSALSINVLIDFGPLPRGRPSPPILSSARFLPPLVAARRARVIDLHIYLLSFYCLVYTVPRYLYRIILGNGQVRSFIGGSKEIRSDYSFLPLRKNSSPLSFVRFFFRLSKDVTTSRVVSFGGKRFHQNCPSDLLESKSERFKVLSEGGAGLG